MAAKKSTSSRSKSTVTKAESTKVVDHSSDIKAIQDQLGKAEKLIERLSNEVASLKKEVASHDHPHEHDVSNTSSKDTELRAALLRWSPKLARFIK